MTKCVNCGQDDDGTLKSPTFGFAMDAAQAQLLQSFFPTPPMVCQPCLDKRDSMVAHAAKGIELR